MIIKKMFFGLDPGLETSYRRHFGDNWGKNLNMDCILGNIKEFVLVLFSEIVLF